MKVNKLSVLVGGEAGAGIFRTGFIFAKACMRGNFYVYGTNDYQSLIRGGHNFYIVQIDEAPVYSQSDSIDLLLALDSETISYHINDMTYGGGIVYDMGDTGALPYSLDRKDLKIYPIPLTMIVRDELREELIMRNTVALGALVGLLRYDLTILENVLKETFRTEIAESNMKAARKGYEYINENLKDEFAYKLEKTENLGRKKILISGNEAAGLAALRAGCKFYAGYPMTPTTGLLHFMAENERKFQMITIPPEGEIAAINMAIGASFAGARSMVATSGGGFCLMTEGLGMAGMTETPVVILVGQRQGPSTGLPTYSAQGDLRFALHASQGEFPRVVIAPGDVEDCFYETMRAFNWAEKFQVPVILLTDKYLAESQLSVEPFDLDRIRIERGDLITHDYRSDEEYKKHKYTETGVSPRALPSTKDAIIRTNADEHDERGYTAEDAQTTAKMVDKRMKKLEYLARELEDKKIETTKFYGPERADVTILSWGSTKGPIREAMKLLNQEDISANYLQIIYLLPFPKNRIEKVLEEARMTTVVENNRTSQLSGLIREHTLRDVDAKILKYDGRPFSPGQIVQEIKEVLRN